MKFRHSVLQRTAAARLLILGAAALFVASCDNLVSINDLLAQISGGVSGTLTLKQGATAIADGGQKGFSAVADGIPGNFSSPLSFTVTNTGGASSNLTIKGVAITGADASDFVVSAPTTGKTLGNNEAYTFTITFDPASYTVPSKTATATITSSAPDFSFTLNGTASAFRLGTAPVPLVNNFGMGYAAVGAANPHVVTTISGFNMGVYEVTYDQWFKVKTWGTTGHGYTFANAGQAGEGNHTGSGQEPVLKISWRDAVVWCNAASELAGLGPAYFADSNWAVTPVVYKDATSTTGVGDVTTGDTNACVDWSATGYRLPTEQQWEYAARRTATTPTQGDRVSGDATGLTPGNYAWYPGTSGQTEAVGLLQPNSLGLYDMSGNAEEWVWDWYVADASLPTTADWHGVASANLAAVIARVHRGGAWDMSVNLLATSYHTGHYLDPGFTKDTTDTDYYIGFRIVGGP